MGIVLLYLLPQETGYSNFKKELHRELHKLLTRAEHPLGVPSKQKPGLNGKVLLYLLS